MDCLVTGCEYVAVAVSEQQVAVAPLDLKEEAVGRRVWRGANSHLQLRHPVPRRW